MAVKVLVVTKGHGFNYNGFYSMFDDNPELLTTQVEQPAARGWLSEGTPVPRRIGRRPDEHEGA